MSKDLLKEAIADAKAVRSTAIANAKLALEEAFTPKLQSMLSAKLQEDEMEDEEELDAMEMAHGDEETEEGTYEGETEEVPADDEVSEMEHEDEEEVTEDAHEDEEEVTEEDEEEDLELEAIIRELEGEEGEEEEVTEEEAVGDIAPEEEEEEVTEEDEEEMLDLDEVIKSLTEEDEEEEEAPADDELAEAYATIKSLKNTLQEVNLLNAKLLFSNKLFKGNNLSESQKMKVIETFDRASNMREVKLVYTTLSESFTSKRAKKGLTEGFASKKSNSTAPKGRIVESNGMADRMKRLAGLL